MLGLVSLGLVLASTAVSFGSPLATEPALSIPLTRKRSGLPLSKRDGPDHIAALEAGIRRAHFKYGMTPPAFDSATLQRRAGFVQLADVTGDVQYYGSITIGTPPIQYEVIMDTGSSDLIMATSPCSGCVSTTPIYQSGASSSSLTSSTRFNIQYGTGAAAGTLAQDSVGIAGYNVPKQIFAACTNFTNIVDGDQSGLLGLGFQTIAQSGATPIVQALAQSGKLPAPEFSFAFARWSDNPASYNTIEPGGILTIGGVNSTLYSGNINYIPLTDAGSYWLIPMTDLKVGGTSTGISYPSVVIDTGTSLIGMPQSAVTAIYARIPGSAPFQSQGLYEYPCATNVQLSFTFGGIDYPMQSSDFNNGPSSSSGKTCVGAVFALASQNGQEQVIFGDAFLKNVYNTYRFTPPAVGFATLANPNNVLQSGTVPRSNGTTQAGIKAGGGTASSAGTSSSSGSGIGPGTASAARGRSDFGALLGVSTLALALALAVAL